MKKIMTCFICVYCFFFNQAHANTDPWLKLQNAYQNVQKQKTIPPKNDPWLKLQTILLPFTETEEKNAFHDPRKASALAIKIDKRLHAYLSLIHKASKTFSIPEAVIKSVIMAESGGNPAVSATSSSAKGLMQTIHSTFQLARSGLTKQGIIISDDPFDPRSSIMAGVWYLDKMYEKAKKDGKIIQPDRNNISSWRYPLEYYYAGPANGIKSQNKIYVFSNGTHRMIDKRAYSKRIQNWARIMRNSHENAT